ncbi:hypothetical protein T10_7314 [Trichinella papuae]|uniref:Uncharacterized protein n=1 Tax=Trichinella papuae TaxID=268474 RepID=A0A0V1N982_9BILA|nr:hypothetical protein T10_7314 [Trichinella papuae]
MKSYLEERQHVMKSQVTGLLNKVDKLLAEGADAITVAETLHALEECFCKCQEAQMQYEIRLGEYLIADGQSGAG